MFSPEIWVMVGYVILGLMVLGILFICWGLYASYNKNKNTVLSLPSLDEINATPQQSDVFKDIASEKIASSAATGNTAGLSRRELRNRKTEAPAAPKNAVADTSSFFDDDEDEFKLTEGKDY